MLKLNMQNYKIIYIKIFKKKQTKKFGGHLIQIFYIIIFILTISVILFFK